MFLTSPLFTGIAPQKIPLSQSTVSIPATKAEAPSSRLSELKIDNFHLHNQQRSSSKLPRFGSNPPSIAESTSSERHNRLMEIFKDPNSPLGRLLHYNGSDPMNDGEHHWDLYHLSESLNDESSWDNKPFTWKGIYRWLHRVWPPADK